MAPKTFGQATSIRKRIFEFKGGAGLSNDNVTIAIFKGTPHPETIEHLSFHLPDMNLEDPGEEIGPEAPGSPHIGLWFHDPDNYRWESSLQNGVDK